MATFPPWDPGPPAPNYPILHRLPCTRALAPDDISGTWPARLVGDYCWCFCGARNPLRTGRAPFTQQPGGWAPRYGRRATAERPDVELPTPQHRSTAAARAADAERPDVELPTPPSWGQLYWGQRTRALSSWNC